jgi:hypothetical protein
LTVGVVTVSFFFFGTGLVLVLVFFFVVVAVYVVYVVDGDDDDQRACSRSCSCRATAVEKQQVVRAWKTTQKEVVEMMNRSEGFSRSLFIFPVFSSSLSSCYYTVRA